MKNFNKHQIKDVELAEVTAINALHYLILNEERLFSFVGSAGIDVSQMATLMKEQGFLAAILDYYLSDEEFLLEYCESAKIKPASIQRAALLLGGGIWERDIP